MLAAAGRTNAPWGSITPIQSLVDRACDPGIAAPNYGLNLELADYINDKKANSPRDAAIEVVKMVNHRNPHVSILALHLLDTLVKNCGYPFQLQIATKEFLNEMVRRFPERPPVFPGPVMGKILEMINEWKLTICVTSKWKEDLVHIRDMHRLLSYKGYRFPTHRPTAAEGPSSSDLKSPAELEEEDRAAKSAKLQELLRRATPRDLEKAQELMKELSGAQPEKQVDYRSQVNKDLDRVQQKAILLNDMLNNAKEGEKVGIEGDAYQQVALFCKQARPKIQKWISEVSEEEPDSMDRLLLINDLINGVIDRFEACRKGDWSAGRQVNPHFTEHTPVAPAPDLIAFDAFAEEEAPAAPAGFDISSQQQQQQYQQPASQPTGIGGLPLDLFSSAPAHSTQTWSSAGQLPSKPSTPLGDLSALYAQSSQQPYRTPAFQQQQVQGGLGWGGAIAGGSGTSTPVPGGISLPMGRSGSGSVIGSGSGPFGGLGGGGNAASASNNSSNGSGKAKAGDPFGDLLEF